MAEISSVISMLLAKKIVDTCVDDFLEGKYEKMDKSHIWKQDQIVSNIFCLNILPKINLTLYADLGYDLKNEKLVRGESGILKNFESKYIKTH